MITRVKLLKKKKDKWKKKENLKIQQLMAEFTSTTSRKLESKSNSWNPKSADQKDQKTSSHLNASNCDDNSKPLSNRNWSAKS